MVTEVRGNTAGAPAATAALPPHQSLEEQLRSLLTLPQPALDATVEASLRREDGLNEDARHRATFERMQALLSLPEDDARRIAAAYQRAARRIGGERLERLAETDRAVATNAFGFRQYRALAGLLSWLPPAPLSGDDRVAAPAEPAQVPAAAA